MKKVDDNKFTMGTQNQGKKIKKLQSEVLRLKKNQKAVYGIAQKYCGGNVEINVIDNCTIEIEVKNGKIEGGITVYPMARNKIRLFCSNM